MNKIISFLAAIIIVLLSSYGSYSQEDTDPVRLFPGDNHFDGWILKDSILSFSHEQLFEHAGEASGLMDEFGLIRSYKAIYVNAKATKIQLDIFEMVGPDAAWGIFTMNSSGKGQSMKVGDASILYDYYIHFVRGKYYIKCTTSYKDEYTIDMITSFALFSSNNIHSTAKEPYIMQAFDFDSMEVIKKKYFKGQIGLNELYEFGHGSIAAFDAGAYCRSEEKLFFVFSYENERKRREWFASAKGKMNMNQRFKEYKLVDDGMTVKDRNGVVFSFKPYKNFIFVLRGYDWKDALIVFDQMASNLEKGQD